jgi:DNA-binding winged helix-turn-helix (wHTH) protein/Flp pilus assembly protein TadD/TolB-like protein
MEYGERRASDNAAINAELLKGFMLGDIVIIPNDNVAIFNGKRRHISPKALEILLFMASNQNKLLSTEQLLKIGWGEKVTKRGNLSHVISELRHVLDDHKESPEFIQTLNRRGYRLIAAVKSVDDKVLYPNLWPSNEVPAPQLSNDNWHLSVALLKNSRLFKVTVAFSISTWVIIQIIALVFPIFNVPEWGLKIVVLLLVIGFPLILLYTWLQEIKIKKNLFYINNNSPRKKLFYKQLLFDFIFIGLLSSFVGFLSMHLIDSIELEQNGLTNNSRLPPSVTLQHDLLAVIPFKFDSHSNVPDYFKATFQGEVINALSNQKNFNLVSQRAINEVAVSSTIKQYAEKLGAKYLLDGQVVANNEEIIVMLNITDTETALQVWASLIKGAPDNLLYVQKELYRKVFNALDLIAKSSTTNVETLISTDDFKAYDSYIQGRGQLANIPTLETTAAAEIHFLNALELDPNFSLANAGLCQTYLEQYALSKNIASFQSAKRICSALTQVSQLKEEAYIALGNLNRISGQYAISDQFYQQALTLNDKNLPAITGIAQNKHTQGDIKQADLLFAKAIQLEPGYWKNYQIYGHFLFSIGHFAQASEQYTKVTLLKPDFEKGFSNLGSSYYLNDELDKASDAWQHSLSISPNAITYSNLGTAFFFQKQFTLATKNYLLATKLTPFDPTLWGNLADAQKFSGDIKNARLSYTKALGLAKEQLKVNPNQETMQASLARYQSELLQCDSALNSIETLRTSQSNDPYIYYDTAIVALNCGQKSLAQTLINTALTLGYPRKILARDIQFISIYSTSTLEKEGKLI